MSIKAEKEFYENVKYNSDLAKFNAKPRHRNILIASRRFDGVKTEEVLEKLAEVGIKRDKRTLQRYVKDGLIPKPQKKGKHADYPEETPNEFFASWIMKQARKSTEEVARARESALLFEEKCFKDNPEFKTHLHDAAMVVFTDKEPEEKQKLLEEIFSNIDEAKRSEFRDMLDLNFEFMDEHPSALSWWVWLHFPAWAEAPRAGFNPKR